MRSGLAVAAIAAVLTTALPARSAIAVQRGIGGAQLHMTKAGVRARLGPPRRVLTGKNDFGRYTNFIYPRVTVMFQSGSRVTALRTTSRLERTPSGIGVGSTEAAVKSRVTRIQCRSEFGFRHCFVGRFRPGQVITDFQIRKGPVSSVVVGIVLD